MQNLTSQIGKSSKFLKNAKNPKVGHIEAKITIFSPCTNIFKLMHMLKGVEENPHFFFFGEIVHGDFEIQPSEVGRFSRNFRKIIEKSKISRNSSKMPKSQK